MTKLTDSTAIGMLENIIKTKQYNLDRDISIFAAEAQILQGMAEDIVKEFKAGVRDLPGHDLTEQSHKIRLMLAKIEGQESEIENLKTLIP